MAEAVQCKDCIAAGVARPRKVHQVNGKDAPGKRCREHFYAQRKATRQRNRNRRVEDLYTLTPEEFEELLAFQGGHCYMCPEKVGKTRALSVDHDHSIENRRDSIRGLLCAQCNRILIGRYTVEQLKLAIEYLEDPPAQRYFREKERRLADAQERTA